MFGNRKDVQISLGWRDGRCRSGHGPLAGRDDEAGGRISGEDSITCRTPVVGAIGHEGSGNLRQLIQYSVGRGRRRRHPCPSNQRRRSVLVREYAGGCTASRLRSTAASAGNGASAIPDAAWLKPRCIVTKPSSAGVFTPGLCPINGPRQRSDAMSSTG
jgi:predicted heme/steroid binding protein